MKLHIGQKKAIIMSIILGATILVLFFTFVLGISAEKKYGEKHTTEYLRLIGEYSFDGGETWREMGKDFDYTPFIGQHDVMIRGKFNRSLSPTESLFLYIDNLGVSFKINNYEVCSFGQPEDIPKFSKTPGRVYISTNYANLITGLDKVEVHLHSYYTGTRTRAIYRNIQKMFLVGYSDTLVNTLMGGGWILTLCGCLLIVSGIYMLISMVFVLRTKIKNEDTIHEIIVKATFGFFAISAGYFVAMGQLYNVLPLLVNRPILCNYMSSLSDYGIVLALAINFMGIVTTKRLQRLLWSITAFLAEFIVVACILQIAGIHDLLELRPIVFILGIVISLIAIPDMIYNAWKKKDRDSYNMLMILALFLVTAVIDIINLYVVEFMGDKSVSEYGVLISTGLQFYRVVHIARENNRKQIELERTKAELSETRITLLISQIQPHFLYNALNTIQYLCVTDAEKAADTVGKFAKYLRGNMDSLSLKEPIEFEKEIDHLENYLAIEKLRFPEISFVYDFETTKFKIPALTVQPLVENSIKYGVRGMEEDGEIKISTYETSDSYIVKVDDNGVGFDLNQKKDDGRSHVGMKNIVSRVERMVGGHVTIESAIGEGTHTTIVIPKEEKNESNRS